MKPAGAGRLPTPTCTINAPKHPSTFYDQSHGRKVRHVRMTGPAYLDRIFTTIVFYSTYICDQGHSKHEHAVSIGLYGFRASCSRNTQLLIYFVFRKNALSYISISGSSKQPGTRRIANNICNKFISRLEEADPLDPMITTG